MRQRLLGETFKNMALLLEIPELDIAVLRLFTIMVSISTPKRHIVALLQQLRMVHVKEIT